MPKRQHLLPKFYLAGFCNPETHAKEGHRRGGDDCVLWVHDRDRGEVRRRGAKKLTVRTHYYSAETPDGVPDTSPEEVLAGIEGRAAPVISRLRRGSGVSEREQAHLALFVASMKFRASGYRPYSESHWRQNEARIRERAFPSLEVLAKRLERAGLPEAKDPKLIERTFGQIRSGEWELELGKNHYIEHLFRLTRKVAWALLRFDWTFVWAPKGYSFATSDDPVLVLGPDGRAADDFLGEHGFASPGARKVCPLTQEVCLLVGWQGRSVKHVGARRDFARLLNQEQTRHYERWLVARDEALVSRLARDRRSVKSA